MRLNSEQRECANSPNPRIMLHAGPGSGKTRTLVAIIEHDQEKMSPERQCVITHTVAAASEIKARLGHRSDMFHIGTIHSLALKLIMMRWSRAGYTRKPEVVSAEEGLRIAKLVAQDIGTNSASLIHALPMCYMKKTKDQIAAWAYVMRMRSMNVLSFDTMLIEAAQMAARNIIDATMVDALYVDEHQDSSDLQRAIIYAINAPRIVLVGDDDQSIYEWEGGRRSGSMDDCGLEGFKAMVLQRNHRSSRPIVNAANKLAENFTHNRGGRVNVCMSDQREPEVAVRSHKLFMPMIVKSVQAAKKLMGSGSVAILARHNLLAEALRAEAEENGVKTGIVIGRKDRDVISDIVNAMESGTGKFGAPAQEDIERFGMAFWFRRLDITTKQRRLAERLFSLGDLSLVRAAAAEGEVSRTFHIGTIHSAKGMEWDHVIMCGCSKDEWEDKRVDTNYLRKLFYVGMTRARKSLTIDYNGKPSQFISEAEL